MIERPQISKMNWNEKKRTQFIAIAFLLVLVIGYALFNSGEEFDLKFVDDTMVFFAPGQQDVVVRLGDIQSLTLTDSFETGEYISGVDSYQYKFGRWKNNDLGEYTLCAHTSVRSFIILKTKQGTVVLNEGSSAGTRDFYEALVTLLRTEGYIQG